MDMNSKRILSVFLAAVLSVTNFCFNNTSTYIHAPKEKFGDTGKVTSDMEVGSTNSVGKYISNFIMQDEAEKVKALGAYSGDFVIEEVFFDSENKRILVKSSQAFSCTMVIKLVDEETGVEYISNENELCSGKNVTTEIKLNYDSLPDYFYVTADLIDSLSNKLCPTYFNENYTREMQEIYAADIHDFDSKYVVNFDEDESTNFLVLNESTVIAESSADTNILVSADYDNNVYVFENFDETVKSLNKNDYFFIYTGDADAIAINVEEVVTDGNTATINASDENIENMFDFIKFESTADTLDANVDMSTADESVKYNGIVYDNKNSWEESESIYNNNLLYANPVHKMADEITAEVGSKLSFPVEYKDDKLSTALEINGSVEIGLKTQFNFYKKFSYVNLSVNLSFPISVSVSAEFNGSPINPDGITLATIKIPIGPSGCYLQIQPKFLVELEAKFEVSYSIEPSFKISYDSDTDKTPKFTSSYGDDAESFTFSLDGKVFVGIELNPSLIVFHEKLAFLSISAKAGVVANGKLETEITGNGEYSSNAFISTDTSGGTSHACGTCVDGDINFVIEGNLKLKVLLIGELKASLAKITIPLGDWYYSSDIGFGWGSCPNIAYKVTFNLTDSAGNIISKAKINLDILELKTGSSGSASCYCKEGTYGYQVSYSNYEDYYDEITINGKAKTINLIIDKAGDIGLESIKDTAVTIPSPNIRESIQKPEDEEDPKVKEIAIVESGQLGDNIYYFIYADGFMLVYGSGEALDGVNYENASLIKEISVESTEGTEGITRVGACFADLENLTRIELPDTLKSIDYLAFKGCSSIETISIPSNVTSIGEFAFSDCKSLKNIWIPPSVKSIGEYAFNNCDSLVCMSIPGTVDWIGDFLFNSCSNLKSVIISDGVEEIGNWIFSNCRDIESITLPFAGHSAEGVSKNDTRAISGSLFCQYASDEGYLPSYEYEEGYYYPGLEARCVPLSLRNITITGGEAIPSYAFAGLSSVTTISLPDTITVINNNAFEDCIKIIDVDFIPESVTKINDEAFARCSGIKNVIIPDKVEFIGERAFTDCINLKDISLSTSLSAINKETFSNCINLCEINIPANVYSIEEFTFNNCDSLTNITIPSNVQTIGDYVFNSCSNLETVVITGGVKKIGEWIFSNCRSIKSITLPFAGHSAIEVAENNERTIGGTLFCQYAPDEGYKNNYEYDEKYYYGGYEWRCVPKSLKNITILGGEAIPSYAFAGLSSVTNISLPSTVTTIRNNAFDDCIKLESLNILESVTTIENEAFKNCQALKQLKICNPNAIIDSNEETIPNTTTIYGYSDSTAQKYADKYKCDFISLGEYNTSATLIGDCDFNGKIESDDIEYLCKYLLGEETINRNQWLNSDINQDGSVNVFDMILMRCILIEINSM